MMMHEGMTPPRQETHGQAPQWRPQGRLAIREASGAQGTCGNLRHLSRVGRRQKVQLGPSRACDACDQPGRTRGESWIQTLCDGHAGGLRRVPSWRSLPADLMSRLHAGAPSI